MWELILIVGGYEFPEPAVHRLSRVPQTKENMMKNMIQGEKHEARPINIVKVNTALKGQYIQASTKSRKISKNEKT